MKGITLEQVDRSLYNHLRIGLSIAGLLPRIEDYLSTNDNEGYQLARKLIKEAEKTTNKPLVDLFGVGTGETREDEAENTKVVLNRSSIDLGSVGGLFTTYHEEQGSKFTRVKNPDNTFDIRYEVRVITKKTAYERLILSLIFSIFGTTRYLPVYSDYQNTTDEFILVNFDSLVDVSAEIDTIERLFRFSVRDVRMLPEELLQSIEVRGNVGNMIEQTNIVPLTSIHYKANLYDDSEDFVIKS